MKWWRSINWRLFKHAEMEIVENSIAERLKHDISEAHRDWINALRHFEYALGKDQVDYAIFAIEASEKRYEMLLRQAKSMQVDWPRVKGGEAG